MSYAVDETYDVYHEIRVFARKAHECDAVLCSEPIRPGDAYWRIQIVHDGKAQTIKRCVRCQAIHEHLRGLGQGERWPDERLACGQDYAEEWGGPPPAEIAALAFWKAGEALPADVPCTPRNPRAECYQWYMAPGRFAAQWASCQRIDVTQPRA